VVTRNLLPVTVPQHKSAGQKYTCILWGCRNFSLKLKLRVCRFVGVGLQNRNTTRHLESVRRRYFHIYYDAAIITQDLILNNIQYENQLWTAHCLGPSENLHRVPPCSVTFIVELLSRSEGPIVINRMGSPSIRKMHEIKRYPSDNIGQNSCARSKCLRFCTTLRSSCHWHHKVLVSIGHFQL